NIRPEVSSYTGRTRTNKLVNLALSSIQGAEDLTGKLINVKIVKGGLYSLEGIVIQ
ncbi:MAG: hypothetical protein HY279_14385, partial [Nitrospinae bacterium]|nr:hypothetical protein [Nitrospinota bacterium]